MLLVAVSATAQTTPRNEVFVPHIAMGQTDNDDVSLMSALTCANPNSLPANARMDFLGDNGMPLPVTITDTAGQPLFQNQSTMNMQLRARAAQRFLVVSDRTIASGWLHVQSDQPVACFAKLVQFNLSSGAANTFNGMMGSGPMMMGTNWQQMVSFMQQMFSQVATMQNLHERFVQVNIDQGEGTTAAQVFVDNTEPGQEPAIVLVNPSLTGTISMQLQLQIGDRTVQRTLLLPPMNHRAILLRDLFQPDVDFSQPFEGTLTITADGVFLVAAIEFTHNDEWTNLPVVHMGSHP